MTIRKPQRIRDPLHNLIEFRSDFFDQMLWSVIQTEEFQRLRRIRQLGFSEFVFPGATHTRFAHSIGVFHTARRLLSVIHKQQGESSFNSSSADAALAAALVHDVGHGMFSHAFEDIGKQLNITLAQHEIVSECLILESQITVELNKLRTSFAAEVAEIVKAKTPKNLYNSVVSSQFDADRLDYVQRDRLMTGVESSGIDETWLLSNLEIASFVTGTDEEATTEVETLVLGSKAFHVAESYVLSLFHLYPNVYLHKTTRAAEKVFISLISRIVFLVREGRTNKTGLFERHPICRFAKAPDNIKNTLSLDDTVFWSALPDMLDADDVIVRHAAACLWRRHLPRCIDVRQLLEQNNPPVKNVTRQDRVQRSLQIDEAAENIANDFLALCEERPEASPPAFVDRARRTPYKKESHDPNSRLNQILIKQPDGSVLDMADISSVVAEAESFEVCRIYITRGDTESESMLKNIMRTKGGL